tara:strand:- start:755 stop:952 length:198 start_codon:yes stop_codon:yes gene_type:complete
MTFRDKYKNLLVSEANKETVIAEFYEDWTAACKEDGLKDDEIEMISEGLKTVARNFVEEKLLKTK